MRVVKSVVERSLEVLALLAEDARHMPLGEIARMLGEPKSATHRMLTTLCELGWVEQDPRSGTYGLTLRLAILGQRMLAGTRIPDVCQPVLDRLARETEALTRLAIVDGDGLTWIAQSQGARSGLVYQPEVVARVPLDCTANGKAWLSTLPIETGLRLARESRASALRPRGPRAIRNDRQMREALGQARRQGWATAIEEAEEAVAAIAAPIWSSADGHAAVGTVSVAGPLHRIAGAQSQVFAERVLVAAAELGALWPLRTRQASAGQA